MTASAASRRRALAVMLSAGLAPLLPRAAFASGQGGLASLGAVLDRLLPADDLSPSATALGVEGEIAGFLGDEGPLLQLFTLALEWMDGLDGRPFRDLPPMRQAQILDAMAASDHDQIPGRFYHVLRALAVEFAYARPEALGGLPLHPAPQPEGYPP